jgi:hypothetical protein
MALDWLLNPLTFYSGASVCLLTSLGVFVNIKLELSRVRNLAEESEAGSASDKSAIEGLRTEIGKLRESVCSLEAVPCGTPRGVGINLTKRAQVLRMHRRGESVSSIAAALETPSNEIALLLKVHALTEKAS